MYFRMKTRVCSPERRGRLRTKRAAFLLLFLLGSISVPSMYAHHGNAEYDRKSTLTLTGTVTEFSLGNPHSWVAFDVHDEKGGVASHWTVEFGVLRELVEDGWEKDTLKPGDEIKASVHPKRSGDHAGMLVGVITYADGGLLPLKPQPHISKPVRW
jgi:Family of unknown function (DUF6152)